MTDSTDPQADGVATTQSDAYLSKLSDADRAIFLRSSGDPNLEAEIRLLRTILTTLLENLRENYRYFGVLFTILCRAIGLQTKSRAGREDVEEAILQAAEDALQALESEARGGSVGPEHLP